MPALGSSDHVRSKATIDKLPDLIRKAVIEAILRGDTLRQVAEMAGISFASVRDYRDRHILPNLRLTPQVDYLGDSMESTDCENKQKPSIPSNEQTLSNQHPTRSPTQTTQAHNRAILAASPVRRRVESLYRFTTKQLIDAKKAVKVKVCAKTGEEYIDGRDFAPLAPLINQAHKNLELQGRLTGELATDRATTVGIQIVLPVARPAPTTVDVEFDVLKR